MKYAISVKEILKRTVIVEAESLNDAISNVWAAKQDGEISLDYDDYYGDEVVASEYFADGVVPENADVSSFWHLDDRKTLDYILRDVDEIQDDEEFCRAEHDVMLDYCIGKKFKLSNEDLMTIKWRGMLDSYEDWKESYERGELS